MSKKKDQENSRENIYIFCRLETINQTKKSLPRFQIHGYVFHNYTRVYFHMSCRCILKRLKYRPDTLCAPVRPEFSCNFVDISKNGRCYVLRNFVPSFHLYFILFCFFSILKILYLKPLFLFFLYSSDLSILHVTWISLQFLTHGSMKRSLLKFLIDCGKSKTNSAMDLDVSISMGTGDF